MADDQAVTKVVVTREHVAIEHPGGDPVKLAALDRPGVLIAVRMLVDDLAAKEAS